MNQWLLFIKNVVNVNCVYIIHCKYKLTFDCVDDCAYNILLLSYLQSVDLTNRLLINNVRSENCNAECSDKSDTDSSDALDEDAPHIDLDDDTNSKTIQPLTIIKINEEKVDTAIDKQHTNAIKSNDKRINFMIDSYNSEFRPSSRY